MALSFDRAREKMVRNQLEARGIADERILAAFTSVPRHHFVPSKLRRHAYADRPLPIAAGQTISQPYIVAKMLEYLQLKPQDKVLEIGTGSGYQTALLAHLAAEVISLERVSLLAQQARALLAELALSNVTIHEADGSLGWPALAPYDAIVVSAAAPKVPPPLLDQLGEGARLVIPVGQSGQQRLDLWIREAGKLHHRPGPPVAFVPLIGAEAWPD